MSIEKLLEAVKNHNPNADTNLIRLAYDFAEEAHRGQNRMHGETYLEHPYNTAMILADLKMDTTSIVAALLHDIPEEGKYTLKDIETNFGKEVAFLVEGVTKLGKVKYRGIERYLENLRKMFVAMAKDIRVIIIRLADRLDNLKTLDVHPPVKKMRIARETLEIYAPIANRLGIGEIKGQLEDLSFKYLYPEEYKYVDNLLNKFSHAKEKFLNLAIEKVKKNLKKENISIVNIHGRIKHHYSLYKKLVKYNNELPRVYDIVAIRIIVNNITDCYAVLGIIHKLWKPLKGRIKDYIAQPKPNGYQSLHTTVFSINGEIIEFQIRSEKMHEEAEYGVAAHWIYSDETQKGTVDKKTSGKKNDLLWINELNKWRQELEDNQEYLETLKIDVFQNRIFVFTPKGDVINLPDGATPIDFAYHIHSDIGNKCVSARINEKIQPLDSELKSGDLIEIIIDKNRSAPNADWLNFVKTSLARSKIKQAIRTKKGIFRWIPIINKK